MSEGTSSNAIVAKIFSEILSFVHFIVFFTSAVLLYEARDETSDIGRLIALFGLDFWGFFKLLLVGLIFYVVVVGAAVTLIAINENLVGLRHELRQLGEYRQGVATIGDAPDDHELQLKEKEEARRRLIAQGFTSLETPEERDRQTHATTTPDALASLNASSSGEGTAELDHDTRRIWYFAAVFMFKRVLTESAEIKWLS